jgi:hypothetical protein
MRDASVQVGTFAIGTVSLSNQLEIGLPVNFTTIDIPTRGLHVYSVQVRYVGDQVDGQFGEIDIENARLAATGL